MYYLLWILFLWDYFLNNSIHIHHSGVNFWHNISCSGVLTILTYLHFLIAPHLICDLCSFVKPPLRQCSQTLPDPTAILCCSSVCLFVCVCETLTAVFPPTQSYPVRQLEHNSVPTDTHTMCACGHSVNTHPHYLTQRYMKYSHADNTEKRTEIIKLWHAHTQRTCHTYFYTCSLSTAESRTPYKQKTHTYRYNLTFCSIIKHNFIELWMKIVAGEIKQVITTICSWHQKSLCAHCSCEQKSCCLLFAPSFKWISSVVWFANVRIRFRGLCL